MTDFNARLQELQRQSARKKHLESVLSELRNQRFELEERVDELEAIKLSEQADVERLEGGSLTSFFYNVIGKMDEKLNKEREEAYAARVKYDAAALELRSVIDDIQRCEAELRNLEGCDRRYEQLLKEKAASIRASGNINADKMLSLERRLGYINSQKREILEAITAGQSAMETAQAVLSSLDSAEGWGTFDLFGGGLLADIAKHSHLDSAQAMVHQLQHELRAFKTELADVNIRTGDIQISIDGFLRFADYFFDGLFADWAVMDRIGRSKDQVYRTLSEIDNVLRRLSGMLNTLERDREATERQLNELIVKA